MATVKPPELKFRKRKTKMHFACVQLASAWLYPVQTQVWPNPKPYPQLITTMPQPSIHTAMLEELATHHRAIQQQWFWQQVTEVLSDVSEDMSDSSQPSPFGSLISIDMSNIMISSDISMHSELDCTSIISSDSDVSIIDFEVEYYQNWRRRYHELVNHISTTHVLQEAPPVPKSSQLHLLDHWRLYSPKQFISLEALGWAWDIWQSCCTHHW